MGWGRGFFFKILSRLDFSFVYIQTILNSNLFIFKNIHNIEEIYVVSCSTANMTINNPEIIKKVLDRKKNDEYISSPEKTTLSNNIYIYIYKRLKMSYIFVEPRILFTNI